MYIRRYIRWHFISSPSDVNCNLQVKRASESLAVFFGKRPELRITALGPALGGDVQVHIEPIAPGCEYLEHFSSIRARLW